MKSNVSQIPLVQLILLYDLVEYQNGLLCYIIDKTNCPSDGT